MAGSPDRRATDIVLTHKSKFMENEIVLMDKPHGIHTTSLIIAEVFEKRHDNVLQDIKKLECSDEFRLLNFQERDYVDSRGKTQPMYIITRDGFSFLVMGYTGKKAAEFKEKFIKSFNKNYELLNDRASIIARGYKYAIEDFKQLQANYSETSNKLLEANTQLEKQAPIIDDAKSGLSSSSKLTTTQIAQGLGTSAIKLNRFLRLHDILRLQQTNNRLNSKQLGLIKHDLFDLKILTINQHA